MRKIAKSRIPEYQAWRNMVVRCTNPKYKFYHRHGGRGIKVCDRWRGSYAAFLEDMGVKPSPSLTLDRIDNDGDYTPENCRWATRKEQSRNSRTNHNLTFQGKTQCLAAWADETGIKAGTLYSRLKNGWSTERALTEPARRRWRNQRISTISWAVRQAI